MHRLDVRRLRQRMHQTQEEFGQHFPVDVKTVGRWERGERQPSPMARSVMQTLQERLVTRDQEPHDE